MAPCQGGSGWTDSADSGRRSASADQQVVRVGMYPRTDGSMAVFGKQRRREQPVNTDMHTETGSHMMEDRLRQWEGGIAAIIPHFLA